MSDPTVTGAIVDKLTQALTYLASAGDDAVSAAEVGQQRAVQVGQLQAGRKWGGQQGPLDFMAQYGAKLQDIADRLHAIQAELIDLHVDVTRVLNDLTMTDEDATQLINGIATPSVPRQTAL